MNWVKEVFNTEKPIIAMCHMQAMPGDPYYNSQKGMKEVLDKCRHDLLALQKGGVDAVMFSNEFSLPYLTKVRTETVACMASIIGQLMDEIEVPYGVNCLWDPVASLDLAVAVDAKFVREIFTGVYASDFGLWNTNCGEVVRHQREIGAENVKLLFNIVPEAAQYLTDRTIESIASTTVFNCRPDALCVSGATAGSATNPETLKRAKNAVGDTPVFANTGCRPDTIEGLLSIADGAVVGTTFKIDGKFQNLTDENRVKNFMDIVKDFRRK
ncbi:MAG: BtpA/SgcQ family protein [Dysosmobacter sp.]|nr:BtpA/SgcQ family protein [Dysosmobacter sp.]